VLGFTGNAEADSADQSQGCGRGGISPTKSTPAYVFNRGADGKYRQED
jgi:hypothetical protein